MVLLLALGMVFAIPDLSVDASEENEVFRERVNGIEFEIPYPESEVYLEKSVDGLFSKIEVYDINTNELLDTFEVEDEPQEEFSIMSTTTLKNVSRVRNDNGLETRLRARIEVFSVDSFRQINRVLSTGWFTGSGSHTLERESADSTSVTGKFPTLGIKVLGDATIEIETSESYNAGWSAAGFNFGGTFGGINYFRKYIEMSFTYSVYWKLVSDEFLYK